mgnify:CR=1 FL=1
MHRYLVVAVLLMTAAAVAAGCGGDDAKSRIFEDAKPIEIINPQLCKPVYIDDNGDGDTFDFGVSTTELGIDEERVFAAIFNDYPQVQSSRIINPENAVWIWHSGMRSRTSALSGHLTFADGINTDKAGNPSGLSSCGELGNCSALVSELLERTREANYYFVMWAWDGDREISYFSDRFIEFCVTNLKGDAERCMPSKGCP